MTASEHACPPSAGLQRTADNQPPELVALKLSPTLMTAVVGEMNAETAVLTSTTEVAKAFFSMVM